MRGILYQGPSKIDGGSIVCIATDTVNQKTGAMIQTWILRADVHPGDAIRTGQDESICGDCPLRGVADGTVARGRGCYVNVAFAPSQVYRAFKAGSYYPIEPAMLAGHHIRLGAYGDPAALPVSLIRSLWLTAKCNAHSVTGYTHQWKRRRFARLRKYVMASVESADDAKRAQRMGWRTFRLKRDDDSLLENEFTCPASAEQSYRMDCARCGACDGAGFNARRYSVAINAHGGKGILSNALKVL